MDVIFSQLFTPVLVNPASLVHESETWPLQATGACLIVRVLDTGAFLRPCHRQHLSDLALATHHYLTPPLE